MQPFAIVSLHYLDDGEYSETHVFYGSAEKIESYMKQNGSLTDEIRDSWEHYPSSDDLQRGLESMRIENPEYDYHDIDLYLKS